MYKRLLDFTTFGPFSASAGLLIVTMAMTLIKAAASRLVWGQAAKLLPLTV